MKIKMILIPALGLLMLLTIAPAMAAPATKVSVHGGAISSGTSSSSEMWLTNGDITQLRGGGAYGGLNEIYIYPSTVVPDYVLTVKEEYNAMVNWKTGEGVWHFTDTWEYYDANDQLLGTFKGEFTVKSTGAFISPKGIPISWTHLEGHGVLQGDGVFDRQTLMLDSERTRPDRGTFSGFLLTP